METALEARFVVLLLCAHPSVMREEPNSMNGRTNRKLILHLLLQLWTTCTFALANAI
jgi:hypothetical protein